MPNNVAIQTREIRVFLSSTFRDMDAERTCLVKQVFPKVRAACLERQVGFSEIDLRWGVSEEESKNGATVEICLKEIDRCRDFPPFFIGFLGERYGWVPKHDELAAYWEKHSGSQYAAAIRDSIERGISVTELEMELAVLGVGAAEKIANHALFCLRDAIFTDTLYDESVVTNRNIQAIDFYDAGHGKLEALKNKIRASGFLGLDNYTNVEQFGAAIENYLIAQLDHYFPADKVPTALERGNAAHSGFRFHRLQNFLPRIDVREQMIAAIEQRIESPFLGPILVTGPSGQGKSALMADLARHYQTEFAKDWRVIDHYIGADNANYLEGWVDRILQTLNPDIHDIAGDIPVSPKDKVEALSTWISMAARRNNCRYLFILDALDQLSDGGKNLDILTPQTLGPNGILIASAADDTPARTSSANWQTFIEVPPLTNELRTQLVKDTLARYRKSLPDELAQRLATAPQNGSPLFLSLALEELRLDARHETLVPITDEILKQPDAEQLFLNRFLLDADNGRPELPELAACFMALLGASRAGLSENELADLLAQSDDPIAEDTGKPRLPQVYLSRLLNNLAPFLLNKQGRRAPMHRIFGEVALVFYDTASVREVLYVYFAPGYGKEHNEYIARSAAEALHQITALSKLEHNEQKKASTQLVDDLGFVTIPAKLHDDTTNDGNQVTLDAINTITESNHDLLKGLWATEISKLNSVAANMVEASIRDFGEWLKYWGSYSLALAVLEPLLRQQEVLFTDEHEETARTCNILGSLYITLARFAEAKPLLQRALTFQENKHGTEHPNIAGALLTLAGLLAEQGDSEVAEPMYRRALAISESTNGSEHPSTATCLNNLAALLSNHGDYAAAPLYRRSLAIYEKALGPEHPDTAMSINNLALLLKEKGEIDVAEKLYWRALAIFEKTLGPDHPDMGCCLNNLAIILDEKNDAAAEPLYQRSLAISEKTLGSDHPGTASSLNNLAVFLKNHGNYAAAEKLYRRALVIRERILGPEHLDTVGSINNLANLLSHTEDYEGAETLHRRALEIREKSLGLEHHDTLHSLDSLAAVLSDQSKYAAAEPYYRHVLAIRENKHKPEHPDVVRTLTDLSVILYYQGRKSIEMGEFEKASIQLNEALKLALRAKITEGIDACRLELKNLKMAIQQRAEKNCSRTKISQRPYENNTTSMRITSIIVQWFEEQEWEERPKVNEEKQTSSTGFGYQVSDDYSVKCYLDAAENQGNIKLLMYFNETKIPESKIKEATRFVNMVNVGIGIGHLVVIPDERCLRYYAGIDVENATLEPRHISNLLNAGLRTMEKRLPQLMAICFGGKSAEEAIET